MAGTGEAPSDEASAPEAADHVEGLVDPWVVLRRLMAENRGLRPKPDELLAARDGLQERVEQLEVQVCSSRGAPVDRRLLRWDQPLDQRPQRVTGQPRRRRTTPTAK